VPSISSSRVDCSQNLSVYICYYHELRGGHFRSAYSLRQHGTFQFNVIVSALAERKNDNDN